MRKRKIKIPETVTVTITDANGRPVASRPYPFKEMMEVFFLKDGQWGATNETLESKRSLRLKVEKMNGELVLDHDEYVVLSQIAKKPTTGYNPEVGDQVIEYVRAILDAPFVENEN